MRGCWMSKSDATEKLAKHLCEFFDTVTDFPMHENLTFSVNVIKLRTGYYNLTNPRLFIDEEKKIITALN